MEPNFSGYVTKANLKCGDGRTIMHTAFKDQDGKRVPLVYQHNHTDISQVLGYALLTHKTDGVWGDIYLNENQKSKDADVAVKHGDLTMFSIWAKDLDERGYMVHDGVIQEVSLVLAGSNPGAQIANGLLHSGLTDDDENLVVVSGEIVHTGVEESKDESKDESTDESTEASTVADVLATLSEDQRKAVNTVTEAIVTEAVTEALTTEAASTESTDLEHDNLDSKKGPAMSGSNNIFEKDKASKSNINQLKHGDVQAILSVAKGPDGGGGSQASGSLRDLIRSTSGKELMHASDYGIENIEVLFPDAQALMRTPTFIDRRQEWVKTWMNGTSKSPFSRVKTVYADITADEARARGYIKAGQKVEEVFPVFKRTTGPAMIYKKQKLDRQDIIDIRDFDVVAWMKVEMRGKLDEEIARAGLFGDNRPVMVSGELNPDKIPEPTGVSGDGIRSVVNDDDLYATRFSVEMPANPTGGDWNILLDTVTEAGEFYLGSGNKTAFMPYRVATKLLTIRDSFQHRVYKNISEVAGDMDVSSICRVPSELFPADVLCIVLDLADYNYGTDRGGEVTLFDDFDIDFNQYKYLIETYLSGALVMPYSAQIFTSVESSSVQIAPTEPAFDRATNTVTVPSQAGVLYKREDTGLTVSAGTTVVLTEALKSVKLEAFPQNGYHFVDDDDRKDSFTFRYKAPATP